MTFLHNSNVAVQGGASRFNLNTEHYRFLQWEANLDLCFPYRLIKLLQCVWQKNPHTRHTHTHTNSRMGFSYASDRRCILVVTHTTIVGCTIEVTVALCMHSRVLRFFDHRTFNKFCEVFHRLPVQEWTSNLVGVYREPTPPREHREVHCVVEKKPELLQRM